MGGIRILLKLLIQTSKVKKIKLINRASIVSNLNNNMLY